VGAADADVGSQPEPVPFRTVKPRHVLIVRKALAVVRPRFRLDLHGGMHGIPHWTRVWFHGRALAASLDVDPAVLACFAFLHDSQRVDDGFDPMHGQRAADFAVHLRREGVTGTAVAGAA